MLVVLPPSQGKAAPAAGPHLDLGSLSAPVLTATRSAVLEALIEASGAADAARLLDVGPALADELVRNTALRQAPTARAVEVYTGVLYAAAGLDRLSPAAAARASAHVRVVSALWGALTPDDLIPAYRLAMDVDLPSVGPLRTVWAAALPAALDPLADDLVVDCRSAAYAAVWSPPPGVAWVQVRVEQQVGDRRRVVSHHAKHARGLLVGHLVRYRGRAPHDAASLQGVARGLIGRGLVAVELAPAPRRGPRTLTLVVP